MKPFLSLYFFLLFLCLSAFSQGTCDKYEELIQSAHDAVENEEYTKAVKKYNAAKVCDPIKSSEIDALILHVFEEIDQKVKEAEKNLEIAKAAEEKAKRSAVLAKQAQASTLLAKREADRLREVAEEQKLKVMVALAKSQEKENPTYAAHLAEEALQTDSLNEDAKAVYNTIKESSQTEDLFYQVELKGHSAGITSIDINKTGSWIVTGSKDGTARLWTKSGKMLHTFEGHYGFVTDVAFSKDDSLLFSSSTDASLAIWDLKKDKFGSRIRSLTGHSAGINALAVSPIDSIVVTGSADHTAKVWSLGDSTFGQLLDTYDEHEGEILDVSISPDSGLILTASEDNHAFVWKYNESRRARNRVVRTRLNKDITAVSFSPKRSINRYLLAGSLDKKLSLFRANNLRRNNLLEPILEYPNMDYQALAFSRSDEIRFIVSIQSEAQIWILNTANGNDVELTPQFYLKGHEGTIHAVAFAPKDRYVVTGGEDGIAKIWNLPEPKNYDLHSPEYDDLLYHQRMPLEILDYFELEITDEDDYLLGENQYQLLVNAEFLENKITKDSKGNKHADPYESSLLKRIYGKVFTGDFLRKISTEDLLLILETLERNEISNMKAFYSELLETAKKELANRCGTAAPIQLISLASGIEGRLEGVSEEILYKRAINKAVTEFDPFEMRNFFQKIRRTSRDSVQYVSILSQLDAHLLSDSIKFIENKLMPAQNEKLIADYKNYIEDRFEETHSSAYVACMKKIINLELAATSELSELLNISQNLLNNYKNREDKILLHVYKDFDQETWEKILVSQQLKTLGADSLIIFLMEALSREEWYIDHDTVSPFLDHAEFLFSSVHAKKESGNPAFSFALMDISNLLYNKYRNQRAPQSYRRRPRTTPIRRSAQRTLAYPSPRTLSTRPLNRRRTINTRERYRQTPPSTSSTLSPENKAAIKKMYREFDEGVWEKIMLPSKRKTIKVDELTTLLKPALNREESYQLDSLSSPFNSYGETVISWLNAKMDKHDVSFSPFLLRLSNSLYTNYASIRRTRSYTTLYDSFDSKIWQMIMRPSRQNVYGAKSLVDLLPACLSRKASNKSPVSPYTAYTDILSSLIDDKMDSISTKNLETLANRIYSNAQRLSSTDYGNRAERYDYAIKYNEIVHQRLPDDTEIEGRLATMYGNNGWYLVHEGRFVEAYQQTEKAAELGAELDYKDQKELAHTNQALGYLFANEMEKANDIYNRLKCQPYYNRRYKNYAGVFLKDLKALRDHFTQENNAEKLSNHFKKNPKDNMDMFIKRMDDMIKMLSETNCEAQ